MPKLTASEIEAFLGERGHLARIATLRADGSPSVVPVWFLYEDGEDDEWRDLYRRIARRYGDERSMEYYITETVDQPRALVAIELAKAKVTTWRMPRENEPYTGIWAKRYYVDGSKMRKLAESGSGSAAGDKLKIG